MAFNPFANFRKYQKIWMASILLVTMITFVLCTGVGQGDLSDTIMRWVRPRGSTWVKLDGRNVYSSEFYELKERRNMANEFMRKAGKVIVAKMDDVLKPENIKKIEQQNPKEREQLFQIQRLRNTLDLMVGRPRFFTDAGIKLDDLVDFKIWLAEADRLGVELNQEAVLSLIQMELGGREWFNNEVYRYAFYEVRAHHAKVTEATVMQALRDELRARIAQRVLAQGVYLQNGGVRVALTPAQMWDFYKEKRTEYKLSLMPLHVEDFVGKIAAPDETELSIFFDANKANSYDPASEKAGFAIPAQIKAAWISADPASDYYKKAAKLALDLQTNPPLPGPQLAALQLLSSNMAKLAVAQAQFDNVRGQFRTVGPTEPGAELSIAAYVTRKDPIVAAALLGAGARLDAGIAVLPSHLAMGFLHHKKAYETGAREELRRRVPIFATLALLGGSDHKLAVPGILRNLEFQTNYLPLVTVQDDVLQIVQNNQAVKWVQTHMTLLKKKLDDPDITTRAGMQRVLDSFGQGIGLETNETKEFWHRFNIHEAKELEPLRKSFLAYEQQINIFEGRNTRPETLLKADDFWKMFFGDERFSATGRKYQAKPWPPGITIQSQLVQQARMIPDNPQLEQIARLSEGVETGKPVVMQLFNDAERPFLFWKTADAPPLIPERLDQVRDKVIAAWKFNKARETIVLPRARKIGETMQKSATPILSLSQALDDLKKEYQVKREIIPLGNARNPVAPLIPVSSGGGFGVVQRTYRPYELEPGLITFPRKDTSENLLKLYDLKAPFETGYKPLDEINKALYNEISKDKSPQGKFVQIITNQPQTEFYVATVRDTPFPSHFDFNQSVMQAFGHDQLFDQGQGELAKRMRGDLVRQLEKSYKVDRPGDDIRKSFDSDAVDPVN